MGCQPMSPSSEAAVMGGRIWRCCWLLLNPLSSLVGCTFTSSKNYNLHRKMLSKPTVDQVLPEKVIFRAEKLYIPNKFLVLSVKCNMVKHSVKAGNYPSNTMFVLFLVQKPQNHRSASSHQNRPPQHLWKRYVHCHRQICWQL